MKYSLSGRQSGLYLTKADEIIVQHNDYRIITDYFVDYPETMIILDTPNDKLEELKPIALQYSQISQNFCCCIYNLREAIWFKMNNIKFYYGYSINTYYDVQGLVDLGAEYVKIIAPLTFDIPALTRFNTKFRMVPNVAYDAYIPRADGICGQWVRPEDVKYYEDGIYVFDFEDADLEKERTLHRIYAENGTWPGNINLLITNLDVDADNRALPEEIGLYRSTCRQRCMQSGVCHFCQTAFRFEKTIRENRDSIKKQIARQKEQI